jgi:hypothetical protein
MCGSGQAGRGGRVGRGGGGVAGKTRMVVVNSVGGEGGLRGPAPVLWAGEGMNVKGTTGRMEERHVKATRKVALLPRGAKGYWIKNVLAG